MDAVTNVAHAAQEIILRGSSLLGNVRLSLFQHPLHGQTKTSINRGRIYCTREVRALCDIPTGT